MTRPLTDAQQAYARSGTSGMRKTALRRAQQIASERNFTYDGSLAPTCLRCGRAREDRKGLHCDSCLEAAA